MNINQITFPTIDLFQSLIMSLVKIVNAREIIQVGTGNGELSEKLLSWTESIDGKLICIDFYNDEKTNAQLVNSSLCGKWLFGLSEVVLPSLKAADLYIFDNDYNYHTVFQELSLAWENNQKENKPFIALVRGVGEPFQHRDAYHNPELIPKSARHPYSWEEGIHIEYPEMMPNGFRFKYMALARTEGGDNNGILPAIWDFMKGKDLKLMRHEPFYGLGVVFSTDAPWSDAIMTFLKENDHCHELLQSAEDERIDLISEMAYYNDTNDKIRLNRQNHYFDTGEFCQRMKTLGGKKQGLGLVSVIVPTFNRPQLLKKAITSILEQTYHDIEIIIINDCGESIQEVVAYFNHPSIRSLEHKVNKGLPAARNTGIKHAQGKYIAYLDDDDSYHSNHIEVMINALSESGFKAAYTNTFSTMQVVAQDNFVTCKKELLLLKPVDLKSMLIRNRLYPLCICHEKACLDVTGVFDESLQRHEDWDLWIRFVQYFPFFHIPMALSEYASTLGSSRMMALWSAPFLNTTFIIHERYHHLVKDDPYILSAQKDFRKALAYTSLMQLEQMSDEQIIQLKPEQTIQNIFNHCQNPLFADDVREIRALEHTITHKLKK